MPRRIGDLRNKGFRARRSSPELLQDPDHDGATTTAAKPFPAPPSCEYSQTLVGGRPLKLFTDRALDQNPHL